jgi:hypothetical protein
LQNTSFFSHPFSSEGKRRVTERRGKGSDEGEVEEEVKKAAPSTWPDFEEKVNVGYAWGASKSDTHLIVSVKAVMK